MHIFKNQKLSCELQYIVIDQEPWFDGLLVAKTLGYENPSRALRKHIRDKHRQKVDMLAKTTNLVVSDLRKDSWLISEPGLYSLIMHSKMDLAHDFQDWVFEVVLPSIRKTGQYIIRNHPVQKRLAFKIENEMDLQSKVVNFLRNRYPDSLFICTLGELQDTPQKRLDSYKMGYMKGIPDLLITNLHKKFAGFAIEFKTPKGTGIVSPDQESMLEKYKQNNWKTLLTNDYDDCIVQLVDYFEGVRVKCEHCSMKFKSKKTIKNHHRYFHKIEN